MMNIRVNKKKLDDISLEWNTVCEKRHIIIDNGQDISLLYVTMPCILNGVRKHSPKRVLDVGCGTGYLTNKLADECNMCFGIDVSERSIIVAKNKYKKENMTFVNSSIAKFSPHIKFDICISNMVFMTDPELDNSLSVINNLLDEHGILLITITHPCFWPRYWKYQDEDWFEYNQEIFIQHEFCTSLSNPLGVTTHIHRPLEQYFSSIINAGFVIEEIIEPSPIKETPEEYKYEYPRFLYLQCKKR